jgi:outer membrane lipoprotein SlyB
MTLASQASQFVTREDTMRRHHLAAIIISFSFSATASAGDIDTGAVIGGAIGGGAGGGIGSKVGGTSGAVIGGAIGGAAGAAIGSSSTKKESQKVVVQERVVEKEVRVVEVQEVERSGPPGHRRGKKKGWQKHD